jgi:hypothetical protein
LVNAVWTLGDSKEGLPIYALNAGDKEIFSIPIERSRVENRIDRQALQEVGIMLLREVVSPG